MEGAAAEPAKKWGKSISFYQEKSRKIVVLQWFYHVSPAKYEDFMYLIMAISHDIMGNNDLTSKIVDLAKLLWINHWNRTKNSGLTSKYQGFMEMSYM